MTRKSQRSLYRQVSAAVGARIREERLRQDLSQGDLAEISGVARGTIVTIETGRQGIDLLQFIQLAHALGVSFQYLLRDLRFTETKE